jgi:hypothetical protein
MLLIAVLVVHRHILELQMDPTTSHEGLKTEVPTLSAAYASTL